MHNNNIISTVLAVRTVIAAFQLVYVLRTVFDYVLVHTTVRTVVLYVE